MVEVASQVAGGKYFTTRLLTVSLSCWNTCGRDPADDTRFQISLIKHLQQVVLSLQYNHVWTKIDSSDQSVTVPKILNDIDTDNLFRYQIFPIPVLFSVPNFSEYGSETFSDTNFYRNRFQYHQNSEKFPLPLPRSGTGTHKKSYKSRFFTKFF